MAYSLERPTSTGPWSTFSLDNEVFAVHAADVQEVMMLQPLTPVPLAPPHIVGLLNLRGQVMPAIDLRKRLHFGPRDDGKESSLLVLKTEDSLISVVVDSIGDVVEVDPSRWESPPETLHAKHKQFVFGIFPVERGVVLGVRVAALASDEDPGKLGGNQ